MRGKASDLFHVTASLMPDVIPFPEQAEQQKQEERM